MLGGLWAAARHGRGDGQGAGKEGGVDLVISIPRASPQREWEVDGNPRRRPVAPLPPASLLPGPMRPGGQNECETAAPGSPSAFFLPPGEVSVMFAQGAVFGLF